MGRAGKHNDSFRNFKTEKKQSFEQVILQNAKESLQTTLGLERSGGEARWGSNKLGDLSSKTYGSFLPMLLFQDALVLHSVAFSWVIAGCLNELSH